MTHNLTKHNWAFSVQAVSFGRFLDRDFLSYRRLLLDRALNASSHLMSGIVLDVGGKGTQLRGRFRRPPRAGTRWVVINCESSVAPHLVADGVNLPILSESTHCVVCTEVLEHLANPAACIDEILRVLRPDGVVIASVPFLYPVHGDPSDYSRWTADGLARLFREFRDVTITPMGGVWGCVGMFIETAYRYRRGPVHYRWLWKHPLIALGRLLCWLDARSRPACASSAFTTGYFVTARR